MKSFIVFFSIVILAFFTFPAVAQHSEHHPGQRQAIKSDSIAGMMSGGMMQGGMMGSQGMMGKCQMCGQMMKSGMMGGQGMMGKCQMCGQMMKSGMMGGQGMMGNMMQGMHGGMGMMFNHPIMKKQMMLINKLPQMQAVLSLTDDQVGQLQQMQNDFRKGQIDLQAALEKKVIDLDTAIDKGASVSDVRSVVKEIADIKINMAMQAYETAGKMKNVLKVEQKEKLKNQKSGDMMGEMMN